MTQPRAATSDLVTERQDEAFWDLVCADDDWLRAEFDAIIAAEFPDLHHSGRPRPPMRPGQGPGPDRPPARPADAALRPRAVPSGAVARQRGPPSA